MAPSQQALTQRTIDALLRDRQPKRRIVRDASVPGFYAKPLDRSVSWWFEYKPRALGVGTGKRPGTRHVRIGDTGTHSLAEARQTAARLRAQVQAGGDPKREAEEACERTEAERLTAAKAEAVAAAGRVTAGEKLTAYEAVLASRGRSERHQQDELRQVRLALDSAAARGITPADIAVTTVEKMMHSCPAGSRKARFSALDRFLRWACKGTGAVPATLLFDRHERPRPPKARRRVLTLDELGALWQAAGRLPHPATADLVLFMLSTPCRRGEAACARWRDFDVKARIWHQPVTKNGDEHRYPLNDLALGILRRRLSDRIQPGDLVFPGPRRAQVFGGWSNLADALADRLGDHMPDWRLHDFRRAFATHLAERGHDEILLDLTINHRGSRSRAGVKGVYQLAQRWDERVAALGEWSALLSRQLAKQSPIRGVA